MNLREILIILQTIYSLSPTLPFRILYSFLPTSNLDFFLLMQNFRVTKIFHTKIQLIHTLANERTRYSRKYYKY